MRAILIAVAIILGLHGIGYAADAREQPISTYDRGVIADDLAGPFIGVGIGYQATDITITSGGEDFSGISADGFTGSAHAGWNFPLGASLYVGPEVELGVSNVNVELGRLGDVLEMDSFGNLVATAKYRLNSGAYVGLRGGYELQYWSAFDNTDVETGWWLIGGELGVTPAPGVTVKATVDYLSLDHVEVDGLVGRNNDAITDALQETDAVRVQLRSSYHFGGSLPPLR